MKILVTGSRGTLGRQLVAQLRARGYEVWGTDLQHSGERQYIRCDIGEFRQVQDVLNRVSPDFVYHLAAEFGRINGEEYYEQLWRTNVIGTRHILECQKSMGSWKLIFASSSEIYGEGHEGALYEELPSEWPLKHLNDYAISKWVNEQQCVNFQERYGSPIMRLRFFNAYGPGEFYHDYRSVVCLFCYRALHGLPYTVYENYHRVFMYVGEFIPTLANACERFVPGSLYNIGGTEYRSVREMSDIVLKTLGKDDSLVTYLPLDQHNVTNKRPDISRALRDLGHETAVTLEEGIPTTIAWMRQEYGL